MPEEFTLPRPMLRKELPEDVIGYLEKTYPARINGAGIKQKDSVNYITEEISFLSDDAVIRCTEKYGMQPLGFLWFLRLYMAEELGWGVDVSTVKEKKMLAFRMNLDYQVSAEDFQEWSSALIDCGVIRVVNGSNGRTYWTTMQQFYNYEYKSWTRMKNNYAKQKSYWKNKAQKEEAEPETVPEVTPAVNVTRFGDGIPKNSFF